ncbi:MAC/Perforin domain-containing protein [Mucilaginibacter sp. OK268]|uniref:MAC/perforin domain-containing protein n=1 Tax=Mucilaginibacter sp. OK268 TaxID=1881048 RepID=UPI00089243DF|nr:MAC/perforin domain-containing protein [Mucilaginibacter sp. OK268]SDP22303.1 MAC/Perforin domain-containing protein [Mucilaginibacter sp. OK268]
MKKLYFFLFITLFWSCKRQNDISPAKNNTPVNDGKLQIRSGGDGKWDLLGYGLDVTGDLLNASSVSDAPIFDVDRFATAYLSRIDVNTTTEGTEQYYGGATAYDYMKDVSSKKSFDINGNSNPKIEGATPDASKSLFSGSLSVNSTDENKTSYSSRYSYATYEVSQKIKRIRFTGDVTTALLTQYLTPEFINNVATLSADALVARYGTHVMLDISIGGRLRFNYSGATLGETDYTKKTSDVKVGLGVSVLNVIGVNLSADKSKEQVTQITTATSQKEYTVKFYGGTNSGRTIAVDKDGNTSETVNIGSWQSSISVTNAALIDVGNALYLYDFIADPAKKALVKAAVDKHINDKQIKLAPQEVYDFYTNQLGRHANNLNPNMYVQYLSDGWHPNGQPFKAYSTPYNNAVPIYQYYNPQLNDRILNPNPNPGWGAWAQNGIIFYAYATSVAGTVPIYSFRIQGGSGKNAYEDHYFSPNKTPFDGTWTNDGVAFYAFAN